MTEEEQWRQVDELMVQHGYFDKATESQLAFMWNIHKNRKREILAKAFEFALRSKKNGTYEYNQIWIRENGEKLKLLDLPALKRWRDSMIASISQKRDYLFAVNAGIDSIIARKNSIIARKKREAQESAAPVPPPSQTVALQPRERRNQNGKIVKYLPVIDEEFQEMQACLARM